MSAGGKGAVGFRAVRTKCLLCALSRLGAECPNRSYKDAYVGKISLAYMKQLHGSCNCM